MAWADVLATPTPGETTGGTSGTSGSFTSVSGNSIVVFCAQYNNTFAGNEITDNKGNTYIMAVAANTSGSASDKVLCAIFYCSNIVGGAGHTITHTPGGAGQFAQMSAVYIEGKITLDKTSSNNATSTTATPGSTGTLTNSRQIAYNCMGVGDGASTINTSTNWTQVDEDETISTSIPYKAQRLTSVTSATTALNPSLTLGTSRPWTDCIATFYETLTVEVDAILKKLTASLNASHQQTAEVDSTLVKLSANINASQPYSMTIGSTLAHLTAALFVLGPAALPTVIARLLGLEETLLRRGGLEQLASRADGLEELAWRRGGLHEAAVRADGSEHATIRRKGLDE